jgi:hypothetical protein
VSTSFLENDGRFGGYFGPGSRCIQQSAQFARKGFPATEVAHKASAACYKMFCRGPLEARELYVLLEGRGVELRCPTATLIDLAAVPGAPLLSHVFLFPLLLIFLSFGLQYVLRLSLCQSRPFLFPFFLFCLLCLVVVQGCCCACVFVLTVSGRVAIESTAVRTDCKLLLSLDE